METKRRKIFDRKGMTLIESLVTISIVVFLVGAISLFIIRSFSVNRFAIEQGLNLSVLQNSLRDFSANLREARQAEDGDYLLTECEDNSMSFYADYDNDGAAEKLSYSLVDRQLILEVVEPDFSQNPPSYTTNAPSTEMIGSGITNNDLSIPIFYYYAEDENSPLPEGSFSPSSVELVRIKVYANVDVENAPNSMMIETVVRPRNIP